MSKPWQQIAALWEVGRIQQRDSKTVAFRQSRFLQRFVQFARTASPFYRDLYRQVPQIVENLAFLPPVTKPELMAHFDEWLTDSRVKRAEIERFMADKRHIGQPYFNRYLLYTSSGSTGRQAIIIQDQAATVYYRTLNMLSLDVRDLLRAMRAGGRWVMIAATTQEHLGSVSGFKSLQRSPLSKILFKQVRILSMAQPLSRIIQQLNEYQPDIIIGYASLLAHLSKEQRSNRLCIRPTLIATGSEWIPREEHLHIAETFQCITSNTYAAAECPSLAFSCKYGYLHSHSDRFILEPVDEYYRPVPPGQVSHTVLLTNLVNRIQPIIRYDLGDRITVYPDPCPCGSLFPAMSIEGRKNDHLLLPGSSGPITILPLAILELLFHIPGVQRVQIIQKAATRISIRLATEPDQDDAQVWRSVVEGLTPFFAEQGVVSVQIERAPEPPGNDPMSGKYRYIWNELASSTSVTSEMVNL
jgi:phenylacetate-CoA ligase